MTREISKFARKVSLSIAALVSLSLTPALTLANTYNFIVRIPGIRPAQSVAPSVTYATLNPNDTATGGAITLSNGNLTDTSSGGAGVRGTLGKSSGKWYYEVTVVALAGGVPPLVGIAGANNALVDGWTGPSDYTYWGWSGGELVWGANSRNAYGTSAVAGDVIGIAVDLDNRQMMFYHNGSSMGTAYTSTSLPAGTYYPFVTDPENGFSTSLTANFGQNPFSYPPPAGYNPGWYQ